MDGSEMRRYFFFLSLIGVCGLGAVEELDDTQLLSFFRGHLMWQEHLQRPDMPYDLEQVIAGMRAADKGAPVPCDEETLQAKVRKFQEDLLAKQTKENLADAEAYLAKIAKEGTTELVPKKLYFKQLKAGEGNAVQPNNTPLLTYTVSAYNRHGENEIFSIDAPRPITLRDTISGFAQGVAGMREGEIRQLFIHPDLAYETYGKFGPNLLIIFKVEIVSADDPKKPEKSEKK
jgi:peptidylprolyl isomerase